MPTKPRTVVITAEVVTAVALSGLRRLVDAALQADERLVVHQIQANVIDQTKPQKPVKTR